LPARLPVLLDRRRPRRAGRPGLRRRRAPADPRELEGWRDHAAGRRGLPPPGQPPGEHRRPADTPSRAGRGRPRADPAPGRGAGSLARPPPHDGRRPAQAGHARRAGPPPGPHEPAPVPRVAAVPRHGGGPEGRRRVALEDRRGPPHGRVRAVPQPVGPGSPARARPTPPRHPRTPARADGLGDGVQDARASPAARRPAADLRGRRSLRAHRAAPPGRRPGPRVRGVTTLLRHSKVDLALHELRPGRSAGRPLLLLHGLGERSPVAPPAGTDGWPGPVVALDFTGHGESTVPAGGGYTPEQLMADADIALAHLGPSTVVGRGLGAYVALLVAGARPAVVRGAVLA